jgi:hypothetical protein
MQASLIVSQTDWQGLLLFSFLCGLAAGAAFALDLAVCHLTGNKSLLNISYGKKNSFVLLLLWSLGAAILAFIGSFGEIIQTNKQTILVLAVAWPILFTKLLKQLPREIETTGDEEEEEE